MKNISQSKWLVVIGSALALVAFFLPAVTYKMTIPFIGDLAQSISISQAAEGAGYVYLIALCFIVTIVCNFLVNSSSPKDPEQVKGFVLGQWVSSIAGFLFSLFVIYKLFRMPAEILGKLSEGLGGLTGGVDISSLLGETANLQTVPSVGFFVLLVGMGLTVFGLNGERTASGRSYPSNYDQSDRNIPDYYPASSAEINNGLETGEPLPQLPVYEPLQEHNPESAFNSFNQAAPAAGASAGERAKRKISAWLVSKEGRNYQLNTGTTNIGRSSSNDIQLMNSRISKQHAKIVESNGQFKLIDLGSTNGTWLNGKMLRNPTLLHSEDMIRFGDAFSVQFITINQSKR